MILLSFAAFVVVGTLGAQSNPSVAVAVAEPQYMNSFYALDANGKLIELERQTVTFHSKAKVFPGYASVKMTTEFKPGHSPVRIAGTAQFIVRGRAPIDPVSREAAGVEGRNRNTRRDDARRRFGACSDSSRRIGQPHQPAGLAMRLVNCTVRHSWRRSSADHGSFRASNPRCIDGGMSI